MAKTELTQIFNPKRLQDLIHLIESHIEEHQYAGAQIAMACQGQIIHEQSFGLARLADPQGGSSRDANSQTLWLLYSNTKVIMACALWRLFEVGLISFNAKVSHYLGGFAKHGKGDITLFELITHQAGFPNREVSEQAYADSKLILQEVNDFELEWSPGSQVFYHSLSAHWVLAMVVEAVLGVNFKQAVLDWVLKPLGLERELFMGLGEGQQERMAYLYEWSPQAPHALVERPESRSKAWQSAGVPGGGAYGSARGMALLYQMMVQGGVLNGIEFVSPQTLEYCLRDYTGERVDMMLGLPMHRALGPHLRGHGINTRGLGTLAHAGVFGHGGVGSSYVWADPLRTFSFAYITNTRAPEPWHSLRMERISNLVHLGLAQ
jgi:CubicO group peptidase (beta-lactamase class C family)